MKLTALCPALLLLALVGESRGADMPVPAAPDVEAHNYVLLDYASHQVLAERGANDRAEPASLTKLMTAYVIFGALKDGRLKLTDPVTISEHAWRAEGSRTF